MLTFSYNAPDVTVWEEGISTPQHLPGTPSDSDYLTDFADEIAHNTRTLTEGVLRSTETALTIQHFADQHV